MHGVHTSTLRKEMFLVIVQKQLQYVTGHAYFWAVSSKTSDRAGDWAGSPESTHQRITVHCCAVLVCPLTG